MRVPVTRADLVRLRAETGHAPGEVVELLGPDQIDLAGEPSAFFELDVGRRALSLRWREGGCTLLGADGRCTAYDARPLACRAFPLSATRGKRGGLKRLRLLPVADCPWERGPPRAPHAVAALFDSLERELAAHHAFVAAFNRETKRRRRLGRGALDESALMTRL